MKLLNCQKCNDVIALISVERTCLCGHTAGRLDDDHVQVTGKARVFALSWFGYLKAEPDAEYIWTLYSEHE